MKRQRVAKKPVSVISLNNSSTPEIGCEVRGRTSGFGICSGLPKPIIRAGGPRLWVGIEPWNHIVASECSVSILGHRVQAHSHGWALAVELHRTVLASISIVLKNHVKSQNPALTTELHLRHRKQHGAGEQIGVRGRDTLYARLDNRGY